jgi:hypothetical protein
MRPPPAIPPPLASVPGDWSVVRNFSHWRVYRVVKTEIVKLVGEDRIVQVFKHNEYHRGTDGSVRVYDGFDAAQNRANKLNSGGLAE